MLADLVHIEGELRPDAGMRVLIVGHPRTIFSRQFRKLNRDCRIYGLRMSYRVTHVMGQRAYRERKFVRILSLFEQVLNKFRSAHIVRQVAEELVAERVISKI